MSCHVSVIYRPGTHSCIILYTCSLENRNAFSVVYHCPRRDFAQKAKSRGGTLVTRAYIKESTYSSNIPSVCQKNLDLLDDVSIVCARKYEMVRMTYSVEQLF